ncbi:hypothetical protein AB1Y20_019327 [Prymnesium parvum]|uniref:Uncharacterized protein n=1 Tax=Prymnesium parvum TaxID=97485 RepID=A0AB34JUB4_PRYPA
MGGGGCGHAHPLLHAAAQLLDGVGVRVVDVDFDAGAQAEQAYEAKQLGLANAEAEEGAAKGGAHGRAYSSRALHLTRVKLVLVDDKGHAVGQPAWAAVHDLLDRLADSSINAFDFVAEEELRRRTRERLHRKERLRVGLFSLATARPDLRGHVIHDTSPGATAAPGVLPGVAGLLQPLREQAPSLSPAAATATTTPPLAPPFAPPSTPHPTTHTITNTLPSPTWTSSARTIRPCLIASPSSPPASHHDHSIARPHHHAKSAAGLLTSRAPPVLPRKQERRRSADEN